MSRAIRNSSSKLLLITRKRTKPFRQNIRFSGAKLVKADGRIKCLECNGMPRLFVSLNGLQSGEKKYQHKSDCSQRELF